MKRILHIIATPRGDHSRTLAVTKAFIEAFTKRNPECYVDQLNVFNQPLQPLTVKIVSGKYVLLGAGQLSDELKSSWRAIELHIERFLSAEGYVISSPMWNFSIPYPLKHYIDIILQPRYLFRYTDKGVEGLAKNKKMLIITSRGGDYGPGSPVHSYDFQEPYLRAVFGFAGIADITFINAQPMDALGEDVRNKKIEEAKALAKKIADSF